MNSNWTLGEFAKKIWYADDGGGGGTLDQLLAWWQDLQTSGPLFGYFPKASKTWLIVKPGNLERAQTMFPGINITDQGYKYLGSYIGSEAGQVQYVNGQVNEWIDFLIKLNNVHIINEFSKHTIFTLHPYRSLKQQDCSLRL